MKTAEEEHIQQTKRSKHAQHTNGNDGAETLPTGKAGVQCGRACGRLPRARVHAWPRPRQRPMRRLTRRPTLDKAHNYQGTI